MYGMMTMLDTYIGKILDKVQVTLYTDKAKVDEITKEARAIYKNRDERVEKMTDEDVETYYSCTLCQSFAPTHVCTVSPERTGLCGAYNWMDCKASFEINPTGPNQPIEKGECLDPVLGQWKGVNEFVNKASRGAVTHYNFYSLVIDPMTTCGCCECIAAMLPSCNGVMTVGRDYTGDTPCGMKFTTLAGVMGGGASSPGFVGHSKFNITQKKFIKGDGGLLRVVWMPKILKEEIKERLDKAGKAMGIDNFYDMIADETVGITEEADAVVVVVSEETATISVVMAGEMIRDLDGPRLRVVLRDILTRDERESDGGERAPEHHRADGDDQRIAAEPDQPVVRGRRAGRLPHGEVEQEDHDHRGEHVHRGDPRAHHETAAHAAAGTHEVGDDDGLAVARAERVERAVGEGDHDDGRHHGAEGGRRDASGSLRLRRRQGRPASREGSGPLPRSRAGSCSGA